MLMNHVFLIKELRANKANILMLPSFKRFKHKEVSMHQTITTSNRNIYAPDVKLDWQR